MPGLLKQIMSVIEFSYFSRCLKIRPLLMISISAFLVAGGQVNFIHFSCSNGDGGGG